MKKWHLTPLILSWIYIDFRDFPFCEKKSMKWRKHQLKNNLEKFEEKNNQEKFGKKINEETDLNQEIVRPAILYKKAMSLKIALSRLVDACLHACYRIGRFL